ncbi:hypothetical protein GCM10009007_21030 [Formosimonas limnophila]|uniref:Uncharacterized protein n=1 Tax=Formosimonas limnophila TaxID=1384487 RepID=A0A8J3G109_9BURK|nr:hypothetical protein [Formosimonas limnophila]GHA79927.1 hypothetical protein GCM10009007_21030 [Formosimonas limnophila]
MSNKSISIPLTEDEALVLFEWLCIFNQSEVDKLFQDDVTEQILFSIENMLESQLVAPFDPDYKIILEEARKRLKN